MNFDNLRKTVLLGAAAIFVWWAWKAPAQDTVTLNAPARVPYAVSQVIQLEQAKIGDDTVIAYIRNSGNSYNLSANDILYLRQEGVSDTVLTAMLTQPKAGIAMASDYSQPVAPAPQYSPQYSAPPPTPAPDTSAYSDYSDYANTATAQPAYVQSAPTSYYYPSSYYYPYSYSYPYYGYSGYYGWPSWGWGWWGGGWHWGWGYHGGWNTGWHGGVGGGWHGSWGGSGFHGVVGGGFHGGGGGGFHGGGGGFHGGGGGFHGGGGGHR